MGVEILQGDCLASLARLPDESVHCVVTSPPYFGLRDYGVDGQIGLEPTPDEFVAKLVAVFREVRRVLRDDGTLWLNLGDSYASDSKGTGGPSAKQLSNAGSRYQSVKCEHGLKAKDLCGIPWRVAFALQVDGWYLRQDIIWHKPNPMPESVRDRCTKAHEYIFLFAKSEKYYFNSEAMKEPAVSAQGKGATGRGRQDYALASGKNTTPQQDHSSWTGGDGVSRNKRSVWTVTTKPFKGAHFATFPPDLIEPCVLAGAPQGGTVLDPFGGAGTTGLVAARHGRNAVLCELNPDYARLARERIANDPRAALADFL
jgi:DNA modification methylase